MTPTEFGPAHRGGGWPYSLLVLVGTGACFWEAGSLFRLSARHGHGDPSLFWFVGGLLILGLLFGAAAIAFWFYPWSRARIIVEPEGMTLAVRGLGARPERHFGWQDIVAFYVMELPRGASTFGWTLAESAGTGRVSVRKAALRADPVDVFRAAQAMLHAQGLGLDGPDLKPPVMGRRQWVIRRTRS